MDCPPVQSDALSFVDCSWGPEGSPAIFTRAQGRLRASECVALMGPSGSGKSVLFRILTGLIPPRTGEVKIHRNRIGMLFQQNALFDSMNVLENLLFPMEEIGVEGPLEDKARALLKAVGLEESAALRVEELSGGMQKRLGIARALSVEPEIVLYDEPTAGLDPITSKQIAALLQSLTRRQGSASILITNDPMRALQIADRIWFLNERVLEDLGSPSEVSRLEKSHPFYSFFTGQSGR